MRILSAREAKELDEAADRQLKMPISLLMENAGRGSFEVMDKLAGPIDKKFTIILVGMGNNGGDALVIARQIFSAGGQVKVFLFGKPEKMSNLCALNYQILETLGVDLTWMGEPYGQTAFYTALPYADIVVEGLVGTGFKGAVYEDLVPFLKAINQCKCVFSLDIPIGVNADTGEVEGEAVKAKYTLTFGTPKQGMYLYPGRQYCGEVITVSLGVPVNALVSFNEQTELVDRELVGELLPNRHSTDHKGTHGHVLVIGGSKGMLGAPVMSAHASVYSGAGKTTLAVTSDIYDTICPLLIPEVMVKSLENSDKYDWKALFEDKAVVAVGPGIGRGKEGATLVKCVLKHYEGPLVLDADALYLIEDELEHLRKRKYPVVLTPHPGEFSKLSGFSIKDIEGDRISMARRFSQKYGVVLVLKGAPTVVAFPTGEVGVNASGNSGMGTGGMGDVLTGIIASLWGQTKSVDTATLCGVYLHGLSADLLAKERPIGYTASDVATQFGRTLLEVSKSLC